MFDQRFDLGSVTGIAVIGGGTWRVGTGFDTRNNRLSTRVEFDPLIQKVSLGVDRCRVLSNGGLNSFDRKPMR